MPHPGRVRCRPFQNRLVGKKSVWLARRRRRTGRIAGAVLPPGRACSPAVLSADAASAGSDRAARGPQGACRRAPARSPGPAHAQPADQPPTAGPGADGPARGARQGAMSAARPTWIATHRTAGSRLNRSQSVGISASPRAQTILRPSRPSARPGRPSQPHDRPEVAGPDSQPPRSRETIHWRSRVPSHRPSPYPRRAACRRRAAESGRGPP